MIDISVIVPVYNVDKYIEQCIRSILLQTYTDIEIIIVDDGSTDRSSEICDNLSLLDNRIIVIHQKNEGVSSARNVGINEANGKWICFVDGDDYLHPQMLEKTISISENQNSDICLCDYYMVYDNGKQKRNKTIDLKYDELITPQKLTEFCLKTSIDNKICIGVPWGKLYRKDYIINNKFSFVPKLKRNQDIVFNLYSFSNASKISYCNFAGYYYRKWSESAVNRYTPDFDETAMFYLKCVRDFLTNKNDHIFSPLYNHCVNNIFFEGLKLQVFHPDNPKSLKERYKEFEKFCFNSEISIINIDNSQLNFISRIFVFFIKHKLTHLIFFGYQTKNFFKRVIHRKHTDNKQDSD